MTITLHKFIIHNRTTMGKASKVWKYFHKSPQNKDKVTCDVCEAILSSKGERVFSCAGNFSTKKRNRLGLKKLEDLVILKQNHEAVASFKAKYPHLKAVADRNSFDKVRLEETGVQDDEDPDDHDLLCEDTVDSEEEADTDEDDD